MPLPARVAAALALSSVVALGAVTPASAAAPALAEATRYIVRTDSVATTRETAADVREDGGRTGTVYSGVMTGFAATLTPRQVRKLQQDDQVQSVTPDAVFQQRGLQNDPTWGLDRIDQRPTTGNESYRYATTGTGVTAFVIDTGIRTSHHQFAGRARSGYDFVGDDTRAGDCNGHGTHVGGTIGASTYGVAKRVKLVAVRVLDCDGSGWASDIIHGLDWVVRHRPAGPAVVNLSIGGDAYPLIDQAVERTVAAGITVVVAAGNNGEDACRQSPSRAPHAITVAATDRRDSRPSWSNYGRCVDLFAPGVGVRSTAKASDTATATMSGTSMAAPHVTGAVARYLQTHRHATPAQVTSDLLGAATRGAVTRRAGSPDRLLWQAGPVTAPGVVRRLSAVRTDQARAATISWQAPSDDGGCTVTRYLVTRSSGKGAMVTATAPATARSHTFRALSPGRSYTFSVRAVSVQGTGAAAFRSLPGVA